jgi:hypothetical protein
VSVAAYIDIVVRRMEPDLHLIKQGKHVTGSVLDAPARRFAGIPSMGDHRRGRTPGITVANY